MAKSPRKGSFEDMDREDWIALALCLAIVAVSLALVVWAGKG